MRVSHSLVSLKDYKLLETLKFYNAPVNKTPTCLVSDVSAKAKLPGDYPTYHSSVLHILRGPSVLHSYVVFIHSEIVLYELLLAQLNNSANRFVI